MLCIIDYSKKKEAWEKGKKLFFHMEEMKEKNNDVFRALIRNITDFRWYELAKKNNGDWPHPHESVIKILNLGLITAPEEFLWLPELNLFIVKLKSEEEKLLIKKVIPNAEIYE